jgi:hypothetical protein
MTIEIENDDLTEGMNFVLQIEILEQPVLPQPQTEPLQLVMLYLTL